MTDLSAVIAFIPEPWRGYALATLYAFLATQLAASGLVAVLPAKAFKWRPLRALSWYASITPRDAEGSIKLPFTAPLNPGAMADLARLQAATARVLEMTAGHNLGASIDPPLAKAVREVLAPPSTPAPPSNGQRGSVRVGALLVICVGILVASAMGAVLAGCPKVIREPALPPPPSGCDAGATLCHEGAPWRCGPEGRWSQADRRCDRLSGSDGGTGVLCCATPSALRPGALVHACVPATVCAPEVSR